MLVFLGLTHIKASSSDLEPLEPVLCPHDDPQTHTCYDMTNENRTCIVITFSSCDDAGRHESWQQHRHWWTQDICWNVQQENCTVFKCQKTCCEGWTTDTDGRCDKLIDNDDIRCDNGHVNWADATGPKCECWSNYYGEHCEIPRCEGECKNGGTCRAKSNWLHQCHCPPHFTGPNCESVICLEACLNGGTCVSNGAEAACACPPNYYGKTCKHEIDGTLCPMPNNTDCRRMHCRDQCINTAGCQDGYVCCSDGCSMKCMRPVTKTCLHGDRYYGAGEMFSKDSCTYCTCLTNGTIVCEGITCPELECDSGEPSYEDYLCCPVCRGYDGLPSDYTSPRLSHCYDNVVLPLNVSRYSNTVYLANLHIEAWDFEGIKLQVVFSPSYLDHCQCSTADRTTRLISASAVDRYGGRTECNFRAYVVDPIPPTFVSCPADIYALDDEIVTWDEPRAEDNVGIWNLWSNMDQSDIFGVGEYTVIYSAIDYDGNQATCEFNVFVYGSGTAESQMPYGLSCRKKKAHTVGIVVGTICGAVIIVVLILVAILVMRIRRRHIRRPPASNIHAVSNAQYGIGLFPDYKGSSTKPPDYTPPTNPPAYDELNSPDAKDYKFANPPLYDELSLAGGEKDGVAGDANAASTGIYEPVGGIERDENTVNNPTYGSAQGSVNIPTPRQTDV